MKKKLVGLSIIIILIGAIIVLVKGFNVNLKYRAHKVVKIAIGQDFNIEDIKNISKEVFGKENTQVEKAGLYNDEAWINVIDVSDEQLESIAQKVSDKYSSTQEILVPINDEYEVSDIEDIAKEVLGKDSVKVEKYEDDETYVSIEAGILTEKTVENLVNKINEKYNLTNTTSSIQASKLVVKAELGRVTLLDTAKQYQWYVMVATVLILAYFALRYRKLGSVKVLLKSVALFVFAELLYASIVAIVRYPIDKLAIIAAIAIYIIIATYLNKCFMNQLNENKK